MTQNIFVTEKKSQKYLSFVILLIFTCTFLITNLTLTFSFWSAQRKWFRSLVNIWHFPLLLNYVRLIAYLKNAIPFIQIVHNFVRFFPSYGFCNSIDRVYLNWLSIERFRRNAFSCNFIDFISHACVSTNLMI